MNALVDKPVSQLPLRLIEPENGRFVVVKSHKLIQAQSTLNAREQKLLSALIAQINPKYNYQGDLSVSLTSGEISRLTGVESKHVHKFLFKAASSIMNAKFIYQDDSNSENFEMMTLAPYSKYENKVFTIQFSSLAKEELIQLSRYASYELKQIENLATKYGIRLFELLTDAYNPKRGGKQRARFGVEDLYFRLGIIDKDGAELAKGYVKQFSKFKSRILLPALEEINQNSNIQVFTDEIIYKRQGRKIAEVEFFFRVASGNTINMDDDKLERVLLNLGADQTKIDGWINRSALSPTIEENNSDSEAYIKESLDYLNELIKSGMKIENRVGFLDHLIQNFIAGSPSWANPYSTQYKKKPIESEFVKKYFLGKYHLIEESEKEILSTHGILGSEHYRNLFKEFKAAYNGIRNKA